MNVAETDRNSRFQKKLYAAIRSGAEHTPLPPFETLASRIAENRPVEPYEQFFADASDKRGGHFRLTGMAWAAAAVALLVGGAALVNAVMLTPVQTAPSASQDAFSLRTEYDAFLAEENGIWEDAAETEDAENVTNINNTDSASFSEDCAERILSVCPLIAVPLT